MVQILARYEELRPLQLRTDLAIELDTSDRDAYEFLRPYNEIRMILRCLQFRGTSIASDESLCLAVLLGLGVYHIANGPLESKLARVFKQIEIVPLILLWWNAPRLNVSSLHWAPSTLLQPPGLAFSSGEWPSQMHGSNSINFGWITHHGLRTTLPGILLVCPAIEDLLRENVQFFCDNWNTTIQFVAHSVLERRQSYIARLQPGVEPHSKAHRMSQRLRREAFEEFGDRFAPLLLRDSLHKSDSFDDAAAVLVVNIPKSSEHGIPVRYVEPVAVTILPHEEAQERQAVNSESRNDIRGFGMNSMCNWLLD